MCLIIVKPSGVNLPSRKLIDIAWTNNHDGFGLAYSDGKKIQITKGAMTLKKAHELINSIANPKSKGIIFHFRFATEGSVCPENCHPFPITSEIDKLKATQLTVTSALVHNGIIPNDQPHTWEGYVGKYTQLPKDSNKIDLSDTQQFIIDYLSKMDTALFNQAVLKLITAYTQSKFAIITPTTIHMLGDFIKDKGLFFSNSSYKQTNYYIPTVTSSPPIEKKGGTCELCGTEASVLYDTNNQSFVCEQCLQYFPSSHYKELMDEESCLAGYP